MTTCATTESAGSNLHVGQESTALLGPLGISPFFAIGVSQQSEHGIAQAASIGSFHSPAGDTRRPTMVNGGHQFRVGFVGFYPERHSGPACDG